MPALSTERIVDVATRISEEEGFEAISMRRLADELGVTAMALYGHVSNKHDVLELIANQYLAEVDLAADEKEWDKRLGRIFRSFHDLMAERPVLAHVLVNQTVDGPATRSMAEVVLSVLRSHGFEDSFAIELFWILASYTVGFSLGRRARVVTDPEVAGDRIARLREATGYPILSELAERYVHPPGAEVFGLGLDLLLNALKELPRRRSD